jgi:hypothetical protein
MNAAWIVYLGYGSDGRPRTLMVDRADRGEITDADVDWLSNLIGESPRLDDTPIHHIPTEAGLDYLALRRQQHPHGETP